MANHDNLPRPEKSTPVAHRRIKRIIIVVLALFLIGGLAVYWWTARRNTSPAEEGPAESASEAPLDPPIERDLAG